MSNDEIDDPFALGLRAVMAATGVKPAPLSVAAGLGNSAVRDLFKKGASPKVSTASAIAGQLGMTIDQVIRAGMGEIIGGTVAGPSRGQVEMVSIYDVSASAGHGAIVDTETVVDKLSFPPGYLRRITNTNPRDLAIIGVKGDSMSPTISQNDVVMVDTAKRDLSFDGLFVLRDGGASLLVKRIGRGSRSGSVILISDNRTYPPTERQIEDIDVVGKVVWMGVKV